MMKPKIHRLAVLIGIFIPVAVFAADAIVPDPGINLRRTVTVQVVEKTKGAVVNISASKTVTRQVSPFAMNPFFQQFNFGQMVQVPATSLGSGFIIHRDGYVVTNNHVVDNASQISVELADGRKLPAQLISTDPDADLALLRIHSDSALPILDLGESNDLMIGEPVIAVGNPLGYSHTVSTGIVSALHRDIDPSRQQQSNVPLRGENAALRDLIQTDAAINPGNSGGPLLNAYGQVIGINTAIRGDAQNIGFAIPIDRLRDLIPELMNPAQANKVEVPLKLVESRQMIEPATVVAEVTAAGSKSRALESIDGQHIGDIVDAYALLLSAKAGVPLKLVWAGGENQTVVPTVAPIPDVRALADVQLGITVEVVMPAIVQENNLAVDSGLYVTKVARGSVADKVGVQPGDVIVQLGRFRMRTLDDLGVFLNRMRGSSSARIAVVRGNELISGLMDY